MATVYTIGHSTRTLEELVTALRAFDVKTLADIRSFPMSRRLPHFNRESLEHELPRCGISYIWMKELGVDERRCATIRLTLGYAMSRFATTRTT